MPRLRVSDERVGVIARVYNTADADEVLSLAEEVKESRAALEQRERKEGSDQRIIWEAVNDVESLLGEDRAFIVEHLIRHIAATWTTEQAVKRIRDLVSFK